MFKHALTHEVAYGSLLLERRRALHSAVADAIRELYADRQADVVEMLAHHYERAERWPDAVPYLAASADKAMAGFSLGEADGYAGRALIALERIQGPPDHPLRAHLHHVQGQCHELRNDWGPAIESYRAMAEAAEAAGDRATQGLGLVLVSLAQIYAHDLAGGRASAGQADAIADELGDLDLTGLSMVSTLFNQSVAGELEGPYARTAELEDTARRANDVFAKIFGLDLAGELLHMRAREEESLSLLREARSLAEEAQIAQLMQWVYFDVALTTTALGRYDEAFEAARKNIALCERVGDKGFWMCRAKNTYGRIFIELCDFARGHEHNQDAVDRALGFGDLETLRNAMLNVGDCALGRGDAEAARACFDDLERDFEADRDPGEWMKWRYVQHLWMSSSMTWLALGEADRALVDADRCLAIADPTGTKRYMSKGRRARARALAALGRSDEALHDAQLALDRALEIGGPEPVWQAHAARADVLTAAGRRDDAAEAARAAIEVVEAIAAAVQEPGGGAALLASAPVARARELARSSG